MFVLGLLLRVGMGNEGRWGFEGRERMGVFGARVGWVVMGKGREEKEWGVMLF